MGFEITFKYHDKIERGYNKDEEKSFKKKIGDPFDDVPIEKVAGAILSQFARRDIWVIDVEITELSKKKISFKETKGGIVIKNKKFLFDGGSEDISSIIVQDIKEVPEQQLSATGVALQPHEMANMAMPAKRPREWITFSPEAPQMNEIKNLRLTIGKKYPVFDKQETSLGVYKYQITDDLNRELWIFDRYFVPMTNLLGDRELGFSESPKEREGGNLLWGKSLVQENDMPAIRGR